MAQLGGVALLRDIFNDIKDLTRSLGRRRDLINMFHAE